MRRRAFTLIELLVVSAIVATLAGLLLPALVGAKSKAHPARCSSTLRQIGIGLALYTTEYSEVFPFSRSPYLHMPFLEFSELLQPHLGAGKPFFLWPLDRGPFNHAALTLRPSWVVTSLKTNDLPFPNSYWYSRGFYYEGRNRFASPRYR
jgi:prepilin-type N-terminal cleavage/methylation domain-containing protein